MTSKKFSFIGTGNMATAIIGGIDTDNICLFDKNPEQFKKFEGKPYTVANSISDAVNFADFIFLSVKPQNFPEVLEEISKVEFDTSKKCFVTIAAGISTEYISDRIGKGLHIIRVMPNTPLMYGNGVTALCRNAFVNDEEYNEIFNIFDNCGTAFSLEEKDMNLVICATSSSPAYVYLFIKSIVDGIAKQGLEISKEVICDMVIGSAQMAKKSDKSLNELIDMVTSKGGTTIEAMNVLYNNNFEQVMLEAMKACTKRAEELGK